MFKRLDVENEPKEVIDEYESAKDVIDDATRYYHEHFAQDENYDSDFEVKSLEQATEFFAANGYEIECTHTQCECPICGSSNITYYSSDIDGCVFWYKCSCDDCDTSFDECYELNFTGHENIIKGDYTE